MNSTPFLFFAKKDNWKSENKKLKEKYSSNEKDKKRAGDGENVL